MAYNSTSWTTDSNTQAGSSGTTTMGGITLYANFITGSTEATAFAAGYHELLSFENANYGVLAANPHLGNDPNPATTFTIADSAGNRASDLIPCLWYVPDNITIDAVYHLEGADADASDTTRMHLMSYTYTSGTASVLTEGTLLAHSADITNAGTTKSYNGTWAVDSGSVSAGKVISATFESDTVNSDYSLQVRVKYHLS